ncbi:MAG: ATP-binding protein [Hespellia sp.]|nr:ATP-binding protein [Hespellia sp.]
MKVGYFDVGNYYTKQEDGTVDSYDRAYLDEISQNTGLEFEYVECESWSHALELLRAHEIDLIGTMQWTKEREETYEICDASYGYSVAELAALGDSDYIYEDYEAISEATIGCVEGYVISRQLQAYMEEKHLNCQIRMYPDQKSLEEALKNGEIDLIAANAHAMQDEWKIIEKFNYAPFYFASWKGNAGLTNTISKTIIQINIHEPDFDDTLVRKYFPQIVNAPYTKEEMDCISENKPYTIYFDENIAPMAWYDEDTDAMQGVLINICEQLEHLTGIDFQVKETGENTNPQSDTTVTYRTLYYNEAYDTSREQGVTDAILDQSFEMYHLLGEDYDEKSTYRIALLQNRNGLKEYLLQKYPASTLNEYESPEDCMKALMDGDADIAFLNSSVAQNIIIKQSYDKVTAIPMTELTFGIALQFHGENAELLSRIVDKAVNLLDQDEINRVMVDYALTTTPDMTFTYLMKQHFRMVLIVCCLVFLVLLTFSVLLTYARVMRKQKDRVQQATQARTDFFARMSHDMRTPMNGILGMISLTKQAKDMDEVTSNMNKAEASGRYMLSLINDTLDLQKLESGKMKFHYQTVRAGEFFDDLAEIIKSSAEQKGVTFEIEEIQVDKESYISIDVIRVNQILTNLVSNAIKFTPKGGSVKIIIECLESDYNMEYFKIRIQDTGIGMSDEFLKNNLFQAYAQESNQMSDQYAGSGLGLAITKNLVDLMQGRIEVDSELGEGTTFTVWLDFERVECAYAAEGITLQKEREMQNQTKLRGKKILLCEDHPLNAEIAKRLLEKAGCEVTWAKDGQSGLDMVAKSAAHAYDAVLMDIRMPVMDGITAAKKIRGLERQDAKTLPILALSANAYDDDIRKCKEAGMNAHIAKPIEPARLYEVLAYHIHF